jgi:aryl-alcohol dehydrogenase-like predicted oxidoreductase
MIAIHALGTSGLKTTAFGLGLAALGRPGYINLGHSEDLHGAYEVKRMERQAWNVLDAAWEAGVRHFDTARSYGRGEAFLAHWLHTRAIAPEQVLVGSKWGYIYTANWQQHADVHEVKEHSLANLRRQWQESQSLLGAYLRLYQIHSATLESGVLKNVDVLNALAALKADGMGIGFSVSGPRQGEVIRRALDVQIDGVRLFDSVQATWNLLDPSAGPALAEAHAGGLGVIVKEALANGRLTARNGALNFAPQRELLVAQAERLTTTIDALALAAVLAQPWADVVLSGATTVEQLRSNLGALGVRWDEEAATALDQVIETPDRYWQDRAQMVWN